MRIVVVAEAEINPTEIRERVKEALTNLFSGDVEIKGEIDDYGSAKLVGEGHGSLEKFRMILQRDRIRAAARAQLFRGNCRVSQQTSRLRRACFILCT